MFIENIRRPINYSLLPFFPALTRWIDLKSIIQQNAREQGRNFNINLDNKITLSNYTAIQVLKDVNRTAKIKKYLYHPLTAITITTLTVVPLFFTSVFVIKIALVLINNIGLFFLINQAAFRTLSETCNSYKRIEEVTSTLTIALENEYEDLEIQ